tara:strand:- start:1340 stop:1762 length:423 start_codon:yes stop_codon:yes gene_type:complete
MALVGTYIHKEFKTSETEFEDYKIEYPDDLIETDPDYNKRGTTEILKQPKEEVIETIYDNSYSYIKAISIWQPNIETLDKFLVNITYQVFESKEKRNTNTENYIYENALISNPIDISKDIMTQCYEIISQSHSMNKLNKD